VHLHEENKGHHEELQSVKVTSGQTSKSKVSKMWSAYHMTILPGNICYANVISCNSKFHKIRHLHLRSELQKYKFINKTIV
jgi:hypothetical protein